MTETLIVTAETVTGIVTETAMVPDLSRDSMQDRLTTGKPAAARKAIIKDSLEVSPIGGTSIFELTNRNANDKLIFKINLKLRDV